MKREIRNSHTRSTSLKNMPRGTVPGPLIGVAKRIFTDISTLNYCISADSASKKYTDKVLNVSIYMVSTYQRSLQNFQKLSEDED